MIAFEPLPALLVVDAAPADPPPAQDLLLASNGSEGTQVTVSITTDDPRLLAELRTGRRITLLWKALGD